MRVLFLPWFNGDVAMRLFLAIDLLPAEITARFPWCALFFRGVRSFGRTAVERTS